MPSKGKMCMEGVLLREQHFHIPSHLIVGATEAQLQKVEDRGATHRLKFATF